MKISRLLKEIIQKDFNIAENLEERFFTLNELKVDVLNSYEYKEITYQDPLGSNRAWEFEDRCGNTLVVTLIEASGEYKSGFRVEGVDTLVFDPTKLPADDKKLGNLQAKIRPCADDKRINTVFKILVEEVIPQYLLKKRPNKLLFNPISKSRERLVDIILTKAVIMYPQIRKKDNYLLYV